MFPATYCNLTCTRCGNKYATKVSLSYHLKVCGVPARFSCVICGYKTKHKGDLKKHFDCMHNPQATVYSCQYCSYSSKHRGNLRKHVICMHNMSVVWFCLCFMKYFVYNIYYINELSEFRKGFFVFKFIYC